VLDANWEDAHFAYGHYLDQLYTDAKQREVRRVPVKPCTCDIATMALQPLPYSLIILAMSTMLFVMAGAVDSASQSLERHHCQGPEVDAAIMLTGQATGQGPGPAGRAQPHQD
jgi:hypothetical protein